MRTYCMIKIGEYTHAGTPITRNKKNNGILLLQMFCTFIPTMLVFLHYAKVFVEF